MLKKLSGCLAAAFVLLLLSGCLEFERQTLTYRYDAKADTLRIFQAYQGIFGAEGKEKLSDTELEQLQSVLSTQRTFFFANWILEYDASQVRQALDELKQPEAQSEKKRDPVAIARRETFFKLLLDNVGVTNGAAYLDEAGKLCGVQRVTVTRFSRIISAANEQIRDLLRRLANEEEASAEERALYLRFAEQTQPYLAMEGNQLRARFPLTRAQYEKSFVKDEDTARLISEFKRSGGRVAYTDGEMKWSVGSPSDQTSAVSLQVSPNRYVSNAVEPVKNRVGLRAKLDVAAAAKEFVLETKSK